MVAISFVRALEDKYVEQEDVSNNLVLPKDKSISTAITFVGFGDVKNVQSQLSRLKSIDLSDQHIQVPGNVSEISDRLRLVETLNLAGNHLGWRHVVDIIVQLPRLRELILTANNLADELPDNGRRLKQGLACLTLGRIEIDWTTLIRTTQRIWPHIKQIDLWDCSLDKEKLILQDPSLESFVRKISSLQLSRNKLIDIDWINQIGPLDSLKELDLSSCRLESIRLSESHIRQLYNLECLNISYNNIESWISISELNKLPNLKILLCQENPFFVLGKFAKLLTIARIEKLEVLNRETVTKNRRRDSEILYIREANHEYEAYLNGQNPTFTESHPRHADLIELYGIPGNPAPKEEDKDICVDICYGNERLTKKLPRNMRVANVQMLCKRLFRIKPSSKIEVTCIDPKCQSKALTYKLDLNGQTLDFYSVTSGFELLVNEVKR